MMKAIFVLSLVCFTLCRAEFSFLGAIKDRVYGSEADKQAKEDRSNHESLNEIMAKNPQVIEEGAKALVSLIIENNKRLRRIAANADLEIIPASENSTSYDSSKKALNILYHTNVVDKANNLICTVKNTMIQYDVAKKTFQSFEGELPTIYVCKTHHVSEAATPLPEEGILFEQTEYVSYNVFEQVHNRAKVEEARAFAKKNFLEAIARKGVSTASLNIEKVTFAGEVFTNHVISLEFTVLYKVNNNGNKTTTVLLDYLVKTNELHLAEPILFFS